MESDEQCSEKRNDELSQSYIQGVERVAQQNNDDIGFSFNLPKEVLQQRKKAWGRIFDKYADDVSDEIELNIKTMEPIALKEMEQEEDDNKEDEGEQRTGEDENEEDEEDEEEEEDGEGENGTGKEKEYFSKSRAPMRKLPALIQYWIDTGNPPYQFVGEEDHSDTGSSLSEGENSRSGQSAILRESFDNNNDNDKEKLNDNSPYSSVDTAAYILSNANKSTNKTDKKGVSDEWKSKMKDRFTNLVISPEAEKNVAEMGVTSLKNCQENGTSIRSPPRAAIPETIANDRSGVTLSEVLPALQQFDDLLEKSKPRRSALSQVRRKRKPVAVVVPEPEKNVENSVPSPCVSQPSQNSEQSTCNTLGKPLNRRKLYTGRNSPIDLIVAKTSTDSTPTTPGNSHPALEPCEKTVSRVESMVNRARARRKRKRASQRRTAIFSENVQNRDSNISQETENPPEIDQGAVHISNTDNSNSNNNNNNNNINNNTEDIIAKKNAKNNDPVGPQIRYTDFFESLGLTPSRTIIGKDQESEKMNTNIGKMTSKKIVNNDKKVVESSGKLTKEIAKSTKKNQEVVESLEITKETTRSTTNPRVSNSSRILTKEIVKSPKRNLEIPQSKEISTTQIAKSPGQNSNIPKSVETVTKKVTKSPRKNIKVAESSERLAKGISKSPRKNAKNLESTKISTKEIPKSPRKNSKVLESSEILTKKIQQSPRKYLKDLESLGGLTKEISKSPRKNSKVTEPVKMTAENLTLAKTNDKLPESTEISKSSEKNLENGNSSRFTNQPVISLPKNVTVSDSLAILTKEIEDLFDEDNIEEPEMPYDFIVDSNLNNNNNKDKQQNNSKIVCDKTLRIKMVRLPEEYLARFSRRKPDNASGDSSDSLEKKNTNIELLTTTHDSDSSTILICSCNRNSADQFSDSDCSSFTKVSQTRTKKLSSLETNVLSKKMNASSNPQDSSNSKDEILENPPKTLPLIENTPKLSETNEKLTSPKKLMISLEKMTPKNINAAKGVTDIFTLMRPRSRKKRLRDANGKFLNLRQIMELSAKILDSSVIANKGAKCVTIGSRISDNNDEKTEKPEVARMKENSSILDLGISTDEDDFTILLRNIGTRPRGTRKSQAIKALDFTDEKDEENKDEKDERKTYKLRARSRSILEIAASSEEEDEDYTVLRKVRSRNRDKRFTANRSKKISEKMKNNEKIKDDVVKKCSSNVETGNRLKNRSKSMEENASIDENNANVVRRTRKRKLRRSDEGSLEKILPRERNRKNNNFSSPHERDSNISRDEKLKLEKTKRSSKMTNTFVPRKRRKISQELNRRSRISTARFKTQIDSESDIDLDEKQTTMKNSSEMMDETDPPVNHDDKKKIVTTNQEKKDSTKNSEASTESFNDSMESEVKLKNDTSSKSHSSCSPRKKKLTRKRKKYSSLTKMEKNRRKSISMKNERKMRILGTPIDYESDEGELEQPRQSLNDDKKRLEQTLRNNKILDAYKGSNDGNESSKIKRRRSGKNLFPPLDDTIVDLDCIFGGNSKKRISGSTQNSHLEAPQIQKYFRNRGKSTFRTKLCTDDEDEGGL